MFKPSSFVEIQTPIRSDSIPFPHPKDLDSLFKPTNASPFSEQNAKQNFDAKTNDTIFEFIRNPKGSAVMNVRERHFVNQIFEYVDFSEILSRPLASVNGDSIRESSFKMGGSSFPIPNVLKGYNDFFINSNDKFSEQINEVFAKIYIDDRERAKFVEFLRSQPSFKLYSESDKLACYDELFGHEAKPAIFVNLSKILGKIFKGEPIKALEYQLSQTEQRILESIVTRKYGQQIVSK
jgi:hypothetical protein